MERVDLPSDRRLVAPTPGDEFVVVHELDVAQVVKVACLLVRGPLTCAHEMGGHADSLDVALSGVIQDEAVDGGPVAECILVTKFVVDGQTGVTVDADESIAVRPDEDGDGDASGGSDGVL